MKTKHCDICGKEIEGKISIRDPNFCRPLEVCGDCLNDCANQDFGKLSNKLKETTK